MGYHKVPIGFLVRLTIMGLTKGNQGKPGRIRSQVEPRGPGIKPFPGPSSRPPGSQSNPLVLEPVSQRHCFIPGGDSHHPAGLFLTRLRGVV